jgi:hypothetical protein
MKKIITLVTMLLTIGVVSTLPITHSSSTMHTSQVVKSDGTPVPDPCPPGQKCSPQFD